MFYTVLHKSGWQADAWRIGKTWNTRKNAEDYVFAKQSADPKSAWYNTKIVAHRNTLAHYLKDDTYRFAGGIIAAV